MPTECSPELFNFAPVEHPAVIAGLDGGAITSDAGGLLLGAADRAWRRDAGSLKVHLRGLAYGGDRLRARAYLAAPTSGALNQTATPIDQVIA